jgi:hypothetical protein
MVTMSAFKFGETDDPFEELLSREITYAHWSDQERKGLNLALKWYEEYKRDKAIYEAENKTPKER